MTTLLIDAMRRLAEAGTGGTGLVRTQVPGLSLVRATAPGGLVHTISCPLVCLVVQGRKEVAMGAQVFSFGAGESLVITADVPIVSRITQASLAVPYLCLALELDAAVIAELTAQMKRPFTTSEEPVRVGRTDAEVADAALRLLQLAGQPDMVAVLHAARARELHYWLLAGRHGAAIRRLGWPESGARRVARAVAVLRAEFARPLPVERLAGVAGMSISSFHRHFLAVTSLTPLQFQKQLRLIEARRLMMAEGASASRAAFAVGYESVPHFTRDYGRMFGLPPARDIDTARRQAA